MGADVIVVGIEKHAAVRRDGVGQLELGGNDVVNGLEGFQMLLPDGGEDAVPGMNQVADFPDIAGVFGPHLRNKHLMGRPQPLPDSAHHPHGGVVAFGRHEDVVFHGQEVVEKVLRAGLAIAAGDAHHDEVRAWPGGGRGRP